MPEAHVALDFIRELYRVEHEAFEANIVGAVEGVAEQEKGKHLPKGAMGEAIRDDLNRWDRLGHFLEDARIPLDADAAVAALWTVALERKNFCSSGTTPPATTSPASTRSWPPEKRTA